VELMAWNDERLDDLTGRMDDGFARIDGEIRNLRTEMREEFKDLRTEMREEFKDVRAEMREEFKDVRTEMQTGFIEVRSEMQAGFAQVRVEIDGMRQMMFRLCLVMIVSLASLIVTLIGSIATGTL
jgi:hypothetical protein